MMDLSKISSRIAAPDLEIYTVLVPFHKGVGKDDWNRHVADEAKQKIEKAVKAMGGRYQVNDNGIMFGAGSNLKSELAEVIKSSLKLEDLSGIFNLKEAKQETRKRKIDETKKAPEPGDTGKPVEPAEPEQGGKAETKGPHTVPMVVQFKSVKGLLNMPKGVKEAFKTMLKTYGKISEDDTGFEVRVNEEDIGKFKFEVSDFVRENEIDDIVSSDPISRSNLEKKKRLKDKIEKTREEKKEEKEKTEPKKKKRKSDKSAEDHASIGVYVNKRSVLEKIRAERKLNSIIAKYKGKADTLPSQGRIRLIFGRNQKDNIENIVHDINDFVDPGEFIGKLINIDDDIDVGRIIEFSLSVDIEGALDILQNGIENSQMWKDMMSNGIVSDIESDEEEEKVSVIFPKLEKEEMMKGRIQQLQYNLYLIMSQNKDLQTIVGMMKPPKLPKPDDDDDDD